MPIQITEAVASLPAPGDSGRLVAQLIDVGWGSSGYYGAEALQAAATDRVFPAGTQMFMDHPTESEGYERPERSVRDLAAFTTEDARWDATAEALVAPVQVLQPFRAVVAEMKDVIGLSIRAAAQVTEGGQVDGRTGRIIDRITEGVSVDFVTKAGRGGRILQLLESAQPALAFTREAAVAQVQEARNIGQWIESRLHLSLTQMADEMFGDGRLTRDERITLSSAVGDGLTSFTSTLEQGAPQLYTRDLWDEPAAIVAAAEAATPHVPVDPAGDTPTQESQEDTMPQIEEAEHRRLVEAAGRVQQLETERDTARQQLAETRARSTARPIAEQIIGESTTLPPLTRARVVNHLVEAASLTDAGALDETALRSAAESARTAAEAEIAEAAEAAGAGRIAGFGARSDQDSEVTEAQLEEARAGAFGRTTRKVSA